MFATSLLAALPIGSASSHGTSGSQSKSKINMPASQLAKLAAPDSLTVPDNKTEAWSQPTLPPTGPTVPDSCLAARRVTTSSNFFQIAGYLDIWQYLALRARLSVSASYDLQCIC